MSTLASIAPPSSPADGTSPPAAKAAASDFQPSDPRPPAPARGSPEARYQAALAKIPAPGTGCHPKLLSAANYGLRAGRAADVLFQEIKTHVPAGKRVVADKEIHDAINKAVNTLDGAPIVAPPQALAHRLVNGDAVRGRYIAEGAGWTEERVMRASTVPIPADPAEHAALLLATLYAPDDLLFLGTRTDVGEGNIKRADEWVSELHGCAPECRPEHLIPNPLTGAWGKNKAGSDSLRCDETVAKFMVCLGEFDTLSFEQQIQFWAAIPLPIMALIHSGGKSLHAFLAPGCIASLSQWRAEVKGEIFDRLLVPLGVDPSCCNPSRLSRLPGAIRPGTDRYQRLLYLCPQPPGYAITETNCDDHSEAPR